MSQIDVVCYRPDVTAPTTPANLTATPSGTSILLACDVATDRAGAADEAITGVVGYRFYSALTQGGTYSALTTEATPGYTHVVGAVQTRWYKVGAVDYVGNVSTLSAAVGATTGGNQAPVWSAIGSQQLYIGSAYFLTLGDYVSDPESQPITITMTAGSLPVGLSFNAAAKRVEGTPTTAQQASATFSASDGFDATAQAVSFTVSVAPVIEFVAESGFTVTSSTGVFEHGATITITGTGFGTGPTVTYFAGGLDGWIESLPGSGAATSGNGWNPGAFVTSAVDTGRGKILDTVTHAAADGKEVSRATISIPPGTWLYASYYVQRTIVWRASPTQAGQHKTIRWRKVQSMSATGVVDQLLATWQNMPAVGGTHQNSYIDMQTADGVSGASQYVNRPSANWAGTHTDWHRVELESFIGAQSGADSTVNCRHRRPGQAPSMGTLKKDFDFYTGAERYAALVFQDYFGNGYDGGQCSIKRDDLYGQVGSRARIELTNSATWGAETRAEIQGLTSWADTQAVAKLNEGGATNLLGMYLHMVLHDGTARLVGQFIEATPSLDNVTLSWTAPVTGDTSISHYRVEWGKLANGAFGEFINSVRVDAPATSVSLQLPPRGYAFRVVTVATDGEESQPAFLGTKLVDDAHVSLRP